MSSPADVQWTDDTAYAAAMRVLYDSRLACEQALMDATATAMTARCRAAMSPCPQLRNVSFGVRTSEYNDEGPEPGAFEMIAVTIADPDLVFPQENTWDYALDVADIRDADGEPLTEIQAGVRSVQAAVSVLDVEVLTRHAGYEDLLIEISQDGVALSFWDITS